MASDLLWRFVHAMSSGEKLFFKRNFSGTSTDKLPLHLQLFDAIASQKKYNEDAILKKCAPGLHAKNIAYQKHYLHQQLCEALLTYDSRKNSGDDLYRMIQLVRLYRKKGLLEEAHAAWKKAVPLARSLESFAMLNLLKTEFEKMVLFSSLHTSYDELFSIFREKVISYETYAEMITLRDIYTETLLLKRKSHYDLDESLREKIHFLLEKIGRCTPPAANQSFWYGHYYRMSRAVLLYLLGDIRVALQLLQEVLSDWKKNSRFLSTHGEYYIEVLYMINYAGILQGAYDYVRTVFNDPLNKLLDEPIQRANFEAIKYLALNKILNKTARYDEVKKLVTQMKNRYLSWEPLLNADLNRTVNLSLGIGFFVLEQYNDALYFTKRAIQWFRDGVRDEHTPVAHILLLLISYSMNDSRLFDSEYRSTHAYFSKRKKKQPFETALVQCLHRTFYLKDSKKKAEEYRKALEVFEANDTNAVQQMSVNIFNYPGWLRSRVERISYRQLVERNVRSSGIEKTADLTSMVPLV